MEIDQDIYRWTVVLAGSSWMLGCGAVVLGRAARTTHGGRGWRQLCCWLCAHVVQRGGPLAGPKRETSFTLAAAKELEKRKLQRARWLIPWGQVAAFMHMASVVLRTAMTLDSRFAASKGAELLDPRFASISVIQDFVVSAVTLLVSLMWAMPSLISLKTLDKWYSVLMAGLVIWISPLSIRSDLVMEYASGVWTIGLCFCLFNLNFHLNALWLVLLTVMASVTILFGERSSGAPNNRQPIHEMVALMVNSVMVGMALHGMNNFVSEMVRLELAASVTRNELGAARSVLRGVCDVVVHLDSDFRLQGESPTLSDMLLLNPLRSIAGEDIRSFLHQEQDQEKFTEQMTRTMLGECDEAGLCAAFNIRMRDGAGIPLAVEAFGVRFVDPEGRQMFFVGIREFTDTAPMTREGEEALRSHGLGGPSGVREGDGQRPDGRRQSFEPDWLDWPPERMVPALPECGHEVPESDSDRSDTTSTCGEGAEALIAVWFDCLSPTYRVANVSTGFQASIGFCGRDDGHLLQWIPTDKREPFIQWVQTMRFGMPGVEAAPVYTGLRICPTFLRRCNMAVVVKARLDTAQPLGSGGGEAPRCPNGCVMAKSDKTARAGTHYTCGSCGGCSSSGHLEGTVERWHCAACNHDECFACQAETQDIVRLLIESPTWTWLSRGDSRPRGRPPLPGDTRGTPHGSASGAGGRLRPPTTSL